MKKHHWTIWDDVAGYTGIVVFLLAFCYAYLAIFVGMSWVHEALIRPGIGESMVMQTFFVFAKGAIYILPVVLGGAAAYVCALPVWATMSDGKGKKNKNQVLQPLALADCLDETG